MRPRRPGRSGSSNTTPAKQNQVTLKTCLEQTWLCPKDVQKRPLVQSGTHPNQIPPKRANPSHFQRDSVSKAGSHSSSRGSSLGHVNALWENVNGTQGKPEPLHYLFTEYLFFSLRTQQWVSLQHSLPVPFLSRNLPCPFYLPASPLHFYISS